MLKDALQAFAPSNTLQNGRRASTTEVHTRTAFPEAFTSIAVRKWTSREPALQSLAYPF